MKIHKILIITIGSFILSGCPVTTKLSLKNSSQLPIRVTNLNGYETEIYPGETKKWNYVPCIHIKSDGNLYHYNTTRTPEKYIVVGKLFLSTNAFFTSDHNLVIYNKNHPDDLMELNKGCSNLHIKSISQ